MKFKTKFESRDWFEWTLRYAEKCGPSLCAIYADEMLEAFRERCFDLPGAAQEMRPEATTRATVSGPTVTEIGPLTPSEDKSWRQQLGFDP